MGLVTLIDQKLNDPLWHIQVNQDKFEALKLKTRL